MLSNNVSSADNQQERSMETKLEGDYWLNNIPSEFGYYISGFVDGEGSFNISLRRNGDYKVGWQVVLSFNVSQKDRTMLSIMKNYLDCGIIKQRSIDNLYSYDVTNPSAIINRIISFFSQYKFLSESKNRNFSIFRKAAELMFSNAHLNNEGLYKILLLREDINTGRGRTRKYSIYDVFPRKSSETICQTSDQLIR
ncbi:LAGLIDADG family homing endonuclease [candidate division WWE3 bacterium]|nr:LAGLIDADG family homing endonuclease [candidate division WWE3 bacterium]